MLQKLLCTALMVYAVTTPAIADTYPSRPIHLIIPFPPGGTTDYVGRLVADRMSKELGQGFVVENRGGGGGSIGTIALAKAEPDGYTIGMATVSTHAVNPACNPKLGYDPLRDFAPITDLAHTANVLTINPKSNIPSVDFKTFLAYVKAHPDQLGYATSGPCSILHMMGEQFKASTGTIINHIPYRGAGPALNDMLGGQVAMMFDNLPSSMPYVKSGQLRALAVAWPKRIDSLPDVPTFAELGLNKVNDPAWYGLVAPAKTSPEIITKLQQVAAKVLAMPDVQARLRTNGAEPIGNNPAEYGSEIKNEAEKMKDLVQKQGISLENK